MKASIILEDEKAILPCQGGWTIRKADKDGIAIALSAKERNTCGLFLSSKTLKRWAKILDKKNRKKNLTLEKR